jgi:hypothetical protein
MAAVVVAWSAFSRARYFLSLNAILSLNPAL